MSSGAETRQSRIHLSDIFGNREEDTNKQTTNEKYLVL